MTPVEGWAALDAVVRERARQDAKWGEQNHPIVRPEPQHGYALPCIEADRLNLPSAREASELCDREHKACRGTYTHIPISTIMQGKKRVDVDELYDSNEYRPKVRHVLGKPMFLY